jgi:hypothetical protein
MMASDRSRRRERRFLEDSLHRGPRASARRGRGPRRRFRWPRFDCGGLERRQGTAEVELGFGARAEYRERVQGRERKLGERSASSSVRGGLLILTRPRQRRVERSKRLPALALVGGTEEDDRAAISQVTPYPFYFSFVQVLLQNDFLFSVFLILEAAVIDLIGAPNVIRKTCIWYCWRAS